MNKMHPRVPIYHLDPVFVMGGVADDGKEGHSEEGGILS